MNGRNSHGSGVRLRILEQLVERSESPRAALRCMFLCTRDVGVNDANEFNETFLLEFVIDASVILAE
jgi:hypothetical protein